jgi:hypothetical protein
MEIWESLHCAARQLQICVENICKVLKGQRKHSGGFKWRYKNAI